MKLELISADRQKPPIVLRQFPVIVGLDPGADICLDDSVIGHYQCMIDHGDGTLMVWDLGTRSGTFINGVRVSPNAPLLSGDELAFGKHRFTVRYGDGIVRPPKAAKHNDAKPVELPHRRREPVRL